MIDVPPWIKTGEQEQQEDSSMISTHCPLHYNGYLQPQQQQQPPQPQASAQPGGGAVTQQPPPPHMYAQHPQMRLQQMQGPGPDQR